MLDRGKVIELKGNDAVVQFVETSACAKCGACFRAGKGLVVTTAENSLKAKVGDLVEVEILPKFVITASFLIFILPLIFLLLGYFVGYGIALSLKVTNFAQNIGILTSIIFFILAWAGIRVYDSHVKKTQKFQSKIVKIVSSS